MKDQVLDAAMQRLYGNLNAELSAVLVEEKFREAIKGKLIDAKKINWDKGSPIDVGPGAYWIFTDTAFQPKQEFTRKKFEFKVDYKLDSGEVLHLKCVYNGQGENTRTRLANHLNNDDPMQSTVSMRVDTFDITKLSDEDQEIVKEKTATYKHFNGNLYFKMVSSVELG